MKLVSVGTIAEYNPFHNGHLYHLRRSRRLAGAEVFVAVMSGNFVQRGHLAIADKWERAEAAVRSGADLVVELPTVFACNAAGYFAKGAIEILEALGVDCISFGSETGNTGELAAIAGEISAQEKNIAAAVRTGVKEGLTYAAARRRAASLIFGDERAALLDGPNNVLAIEYLQRIKKARPLAVKREGQGYDDDAPGAETASAAAIRKMLARGESVSGLVPAPTLQMLERNAAPSEETLFRMICQKALSCEGEELDKAMAGGEGLGNKLKKVVRSASSYEELVQLLKSKRYTRTRIERFLMQILLDLREIPEEAGYIRVLAFSEIGGAFLRQVKKEGSCPLPIISNLNKDIKAYPQLLPTLQKDILAADLYNLAAGRDAYAFSDYVLMPRAL